MQSDHQPAFFQRLFQRVFYNPQANADVKKRGLVADLILKQHYNPISVAADRDWET